jgi:hypothetical protein
MRDSYRSPLPLTAEGAELSGNYGYDLQLYTHDPCNFGVKGLLWVYPRSAIPGAYTAYNHLINESGDDAVDHGTCKSLLAVSRRVA